VTVAKGRHAPDRASLIQKSFEKATALAYIGGEGRRTRLGRNEPRSRQLDRWRTWGAAVIGIALRNNGEGKPYCGFDDSQTIPKPGIKYCRKRLKCAEIATIWDLLHKRLRQRSSAIRI
jgi:hypothetical protein